jgi:ketopantoate reductase
MLYDIQRKNLTEVDFLGGAIAREAKRAGLSAPLHTALAALIKGKGEGWKADT